MKTYTFVALHVTPSTQIDKNTDFRTHGLTCTKT